MRKKWLMAAGTALLLLSACGNSENGASQDDEMPEMLEVDLQVPEHADVDEKVILTAEVTQGEDKVKDADEVEFEIWEEGSKEDSEMIEAENHDDGTYTAEKAFGQDGAFTVQVHVTARGLHNMPKKVIAIGEGASESAEKAEHEHEECDGHEEHHHAEGFSMHFAAPKDPESGKETPLVVHLELDGKPLEKAKVRYEIWKDGEEQHDWADAKELKPGEYQGDYTFDEKSTYSIQIHVENDEGLHEHEEHDVKIH